MNNLPAKRVWAVDVYGVAEEKKPALPALTSGQRHRAYRLGLQAVDRFLKERGFFSNISESSSRLSYDKNRVLIDIAISRPERIAFVTSFPGYEYTKEVAGKTADGQERYRVGAKVTTAKDMLGSEFVVQVIVNTKQMSHKPIFIPLPKEIENPSRYVVQNILGVIALACEKLPEMRDAFNEEIIKDVPIDERIEDQFIDLLPE